MPSPISRTWPTSRRSRPAPNSLICRSRTEAISSGLNLMTASLDELLSDGLDTGAHAGVDHLIADANDQPAEQLGVDNNVQDRLALVAVAHAIKDALTLIVRQRDGRANEDALLLGAPLQLGVILVAHHAH